MATSKDEKSPLIPIVVGLVALSTALAVGLLFWNGGNEPEESPDTPASTAVSETGNRGESAGAPTAISEDGRVEAGNSRPGTNSTGPVEEPAPPNFSDLLGSPGGEADSAVRDEMRTIAESNGSQSQKVAKFKSYFRAQNDAATQNLAVRHLSKLVKDDQYNEYLAGELLDPNQPEAVRAALVRDINARARQVMLPVMVEIATLPEHPLKGYAQETLGRYLGDSYSANPENLRGAVNEFMRRRSDGL